MDSSDNMLAVLDGLLLPTPEEISLKIAGDFRRRRIERGLTREVMARKSGVSLASLTRFEQTGQISLMHLIRLALSMDYLHEIRDIFANPKYSTMEELLQIRRNRNKKKAHTPKPPHHDPH